MHSSQQQSPDLASILRRGRCPVLNERARLFVAPVLDRLQSRSVDVGAAEPLAPIPVGQVAAAIAEATGRSVSAVVIIPDDAGLPHIKKIAEQGLLAPKLRLGEILHRLHGKVVQALAEDVRRGLRENLSRLFSLHDQTAAYTEGFEYATRVSRRDAFYYFLCAAVTGDERRCRSLSELIRCMTRAVPLAIVNERAGIWLAHRV